MVDRLIISLIKQKKKEIVLLKKYFLSYNFYLGKITN